MATRCWMSHRMALRFQGDAADSHQGIGNRVPVLACSAVHNSELAPEVRQVTKQLLEVLDRTSPDGVT